MRIGFVEARDRTTLFRAVARHLHSHETAWLVQNHAYASREMSHATVLRYPRRSDLKMKASTEAADIFKRVAASDRAVLYFQGNTSHYASYYSQITDWFDSFQPEIIFGEASSFHGHITALIADKRGILFLNPESSRYPKGRFSFFVGDRLIPFGGESSASQVVDLDEVLNAIIHAHVSPDYMTVRRSKVEALKTRARMAFEWARGERYNLQSPVSFLSRSRRRSAARAAWEELAQSARGGGPAAEANQRKTSILYPLQMQPEMNLDLWGQQFRSQTNLIKTLAEIADRLDAELWVKPNPKSFHELGNEMLDCVGNLPNVRIISHQVKMKEIDSNVDIVVTVSGTVGIERLLRAKPVLILLDDYKRWVGVSDQNSNFTNIEQIKNLNIEALLSAPVIEPRSVLKNLIDTSYPGVILDPHLAPEVLRDENIKLIVDAFEDVLSLNESKRPDRGTP